VLLARSRCGGDSLATWRRYGGRLGHEEGPHLYSGGPRVGSWDLGLAHGSIELWGLLPRKGEVERDGR
jgi:hypothetical protein